MTSEKEMNTTEVEKAFEYASQQLKEDRSISGSNSAELVARKIEEGFTAGARSRDEEFSRMENAWRYEAHRHRDTIAEQQKEIEQLTDQLREAVEVVRFYALTSNWDQDAKICSEDHEYIQKWYETLGGKRAREFLAKHERIEFLTKHKLNSEEGR